MSDSLKLDPEWMLNAAMLSRPADLTSLVTLSKQKPDRFFQDETVIFKLIQKLLNSQNEDISDLVRLSCIYMLS